MPGSSRSPASPATPSRPSCKALAREFDLGGVIFFARNVESPEQVADLVARGAGAGAGAAALGERRSGGRAGRAPEDAVHGWPPMITLGRSGDEQLVERFATALAAELKAVGITLDYTPVLDILTNPKNPVIGDRALAEKGRGRRAAGRGRSSARCRRPASPPAANIFPGTATPAPTRTSSCR